MEGNQSKKNVMMAGEAQNILVNDYANLCSMKALERPSVHHERRNEGLVSVLALLFDQ